LTIYYNFSFRCSARETFADSVKLTKKEAIELENDLRGGHVDSHKNFGVKSITTHTHVVHEDHHEGGSPTKSDKDKELRMSGTGLR
jgi:hypothetical protein